MTHEEKIQKAKARLMLEHPYFGTIASSMKLEKSDAIESFLSDGRMMAGYCNTMMTILRLLPSRM